MKFARQLSLTLSLLLAISQIYNASSCNSSSSSELAKKAIMDEFAVSPLPDPANVRADLHRVLCSRRSEEVSLRIERAKPVMDPLYQDNPQFRNSEVMESAPKGSIKNWKDLLVEENLYLYTKREDIDSKRIGITGESLGGMHAWFAAAVDTRYAVVVPVIGIQGFRWAIENNKWQARVDSLKPVFDEASADLGKTSIDGEGGEDPRCPVAGLENPRLQTEQAYNQAGYPDKFKIVLEPGIGHQMTKLMFREASDWCDKFLLQE